MELLHAKGAEVSADLGPSSAFKIRPTSAAFRLLSSGLYSDKIGAVLREIGCNAYDAHTSAGINHVPFEVKLPNAGDPIFYVKDFGPGLDEKGVVDVYTTYFESTKQTSNEFTGAFGLGSKSPFAYTDSFTLTAVKDGVRRVYKAHLNEKGQPAVTPLGTSVVDSTDAWQSGVMVSFPVKAADFAEFETKAKVVYRHFATMPRMLGTIAEFRPAQFALEGATLRWSPLEPEGHDSAILMGNVLYPLSVAKVGLSASEAFSEKGEKFRKQFQDIKGISDLLSALRTFMRTGAYLKLPIGTVQITASREHLEYDPQSRQALTDAMLSAMVEFANHVRSLVDDETSSEWQRRLKCKAFVKGEHGSERFGKGDVLAWWAFAGLPTDKVEFFFDDILTVPAWLGGAFVKAHFVGEKSGKRMKSAWSKPILNGYVSGTRLSVPIREDFALVVADTAYSIERAKGAINNGQFKSAVVLSSKKMHRSVFDQELKNLVAEMGNLPVVRASDLNAVSIKKYESGAAGAAPRKNADIALLSKLCEMRILFGEKAGRIRNMALGAVPEDAKYFLLTEKKGSGKHSDVSYWTDNPESGRAQCKLVDGEKVDNLLRAFGEALTHGVPGLTGVAMSGCVLVTMAELKRLKLEELGYRSVIAVISGLLTEFSTIRSFGRALEAFPPQSFSGRGGQYLVNALKGDGVLAALLKKRIGKTRLGVVLQAEASGFAPRLSEQQEALKAVLREWGNAQMVNENLKLLANLYSSSQASTNVDKLVESTLPGWAEFARLTGYNLRDWSELCNKDAKLPPGFEAMFAALFSPVTSEDTDTVVDSSNVTSEREVA
jgi:hypothetical protein